MFQLKLISVIFFISSMAVSKNIELSPENLATVTLKISFERNVRLNEKNQFRFPIEIDSNNKCVLTSLAPTAKKTLFIGRNTEWKSETNSTWNDWDSKNYSFKLVNSGGIFLIKCELSLGGEVLLFNADSGKKSVSPCSKQGGQVKNATSFYSLKNSSSSRTPASTQQHYCVKQIPKVTLAQFKAAFQKRNLSLAMEFQSD